MATGNRPDVEVRSHVDWSLKIAGWKGEKGMSYQLVKSWKDQQGVWQEQKLSLFPSAMCALKFLIDRALARGDALMVTKKRDAQAGAPSEPVASEPSAKAAAAADSVPFEDDDIPF